MNQQLDYLPDDDKDMSIYHTPKRRKRKKKSIPIDIIPFAELPVFVQKRIQHYLECGVGQA